MRISTGHFLQDVWFLYSFDHTRHLHQQLSLRGSRSGFPSWPWGLRSCHSFISPRVSMSNRLQWLQYGLQRQITTDFVKKHFPCKRIIKACSLHRFESVRRSEFMFFIFFRSGYSCIYALSTASVLHIVRCEMPLQSGCHSKHWRDFVINASVNSNLSVAACVPDGWWPDGSPFRTSQGLPTGYVVYCGLFRSVLKVSTYTQHPFVKGGIGNRSWLGHVPTWWLAAISMLGCLFHVGPTVSHSWIGLEEPLQFPPAKLGFRCWA